MSGPDDTRMAVANAIRLVVGDTVGLEREDIARIDALLETREDIYLADLNFDSLAEIGLCMHIERLTGIVVDPSELTSHNSVEAIAKLLIVKSDHS
jgi:acyl carrier protein